MGPGWPEPRSYPVRECLLIILLPQAEGDLRFRLRRRRAAGSIGRSCARHADPTTHQGPPLRPQPHCNEIIEEELNEE